jgi:hypothetical protein
MMSWADSYASLCEYAAIHRVSMGWSFADA